MLELSKLRCKWVVILPPRCSVVGRPLASPGCTQVSKGVHWPSNITVILDRTWVSLWKLGTPIVRLYLKQQVFLFASSLPFCVPRVSMTPKLTAVIHASIFLLLSSTPVSPDATSLFLKGSIGVIGFLILESPCSPHGRQTLLGTPLTMRPRLQRWAWPRWVGGEAAGSVS